CSPGKAKLAIKQGILPLLAIALLILGLMLGN
ncbi:epimerase, partial [Escherichia coli]|nr:epimerase [Escherichia coli]